MQRRFLFLLIAMMVGLTTLNFPTHAQDGGIKFEQAQILGGRGKPFDLEWSPDGTMLAVSSGLGLWLYTADLQDIRAMELPAYDHLDLFEAPGVGELAWSPDGKYLAAGSGYFVPSTRARYAAVWEVETGKLVHLFEREGQAPLYEAARQVAWSPDGTRLAGFARSQFWVWDAASGEVLVNQEHDYELFDNFRWSTVDNTLKLLDTRDLKVISFNPDNGEQISAFNIGNTDNIAIIDSPDDKLSANIDIRTNLLVIKDKKENKERHRFEIAGEDQFLPMYGLWSSNSRYFIIYIATAQPQIIILDMETGDPIFDHALNQTTSIEAIALSPDASYLVTAVLPGVIESYNLETGERVGVTWSSVGSVADIDWSPDGTQLVSASVNDTIIRVWSLASEQPTLALGGHTGWTFSVDWSPDGTKIASGDASPGQEYPSTVKIWDAATGAEIASLPIEGVDEDYGFISGLGWSPDSTKLLAVRDSNSTGNTFLRVWDANTQELLYALDPDTVRMSPVIWGADSNTLLGAVTSTGGIAIIFEDGTRTDNALMKFDVAAQTIIQEIATEEFTAQLAWQPNGALIANGESGGVNRVSFWDSASGTLKLLTENIDQRISALAWRPDGKYVAVGTFRTLAEPIILVYEVRTGGVLLVATLEGHLSFGTGITTLAWSDDGTTLASAADDGRIILWQME